MTIVLLLVGLGLIVLGADWLVDGASGIARKAGVSEFVIGLTIVGFGTSCLDRGFPGQCRYSRRQCDGLQHVQHLVYSWAYVAHCTRGDD